MSNLWVRLEMNYFYLDGSRVKSVVDVQGVDGVVMAEGVSVRCIEKKKLLPSETLGAEQQRAQTVW